MTARKPLTGRPAVTAIALKYGLNADDLIAIYEERAAVRQHEGGQIREVAERGAVEDVRAMAREARR